MISRLIIFIIRLYQIIISPLFGFNKCRFYPSCSNYAIEAVKKKGLIKGFFLAFYRILKCNPFCKGGYDPIK